MTELLKTSNKEYKYKIILTKPDNVIASDIYIIKLNILHHMTSFFLFIILINISIIILNCHFMRRRILKMLYITMEYRMLYSIIY